MNILVKMHFEMFAKYSCRFWSKRNNFSSNLKNRVSSAMVFKRKIWNQKQFRLSRSSLPEVLCKNGIPRNFSKLTGKHLCQSLFLIEVGFRPATLFRKRVWHRCFLVNFEKFLRSPFLKENLWCLLLIITNYANVLP